MSSIDTLHAEEFRRDLGVYSNAAIAVFGVRTREPFRAIETVMEWAKEKEEETQNRVSLPVKVWNILNGWQTYEGDIAEVDFTTPTVKDDVVDVVRALKHIGEKETSDGIFVMFGAHWALDNPAVQQHVKNLTQHCLGNQKRLIFVWPTGTTVPSAIEDDVYILDFKVPSFAELIEVLTCDFSNMQPGCRPQFGDEDKARIVRSGLGMSASEFSNALAIGMVELGDKLDEGTVEAIDFVRIVSAHKTGIINRTDILELLPEANMSEIGGMDLFKGYLVERADAMTNEAAREFGIDPPKGVLLVGPPGGGKSFIATATAGLLGVTGIKFDISRVFAGIVGKTEERTRIALAQIDAMAPCLLLIDEVDKGLGGIANGGGGDSGVSQRVLGTMLTWMQDRRGPPVFVIFTANNVMGLPPELMRMGRLDEIFAVTFPGEVEREAILKIHVEKRGHELPEADYNKIAKATNGFVGAELEGAVKKALIKLWNDRKTNPDAKLVDHLETQARSIVPLSKAFPEKVGLMNEWAKNNAQPASSDMRFDKVTTAETVSSGTGRRVIRRSPSVKLHPRTTVN